MKSLFLGIIHLVRETAYLSEEHLVAIMFSNICILSGVIPKELVLGVQFVGLAFVSP